ncbi:MAG: helix-turn-helix domain-containing protein [Bacteroidota bacterium]
MKSLLYKDLNYKASDVLHFIPFIFIAALFSPFYFMEAGEKITLLNAQIKLGKQSLTPEIYGVLLVQIIHSFCYIFLSVKLLNEAMRGNQIRSLDKKYGWLRKFSYGFLIFWSIDFLAVLWYIVQGEIDKEAYYITMLSCAIIINILVIFAIKNNKIFIQMFLNKNRIKYETSSANTSDLRIYLKEIMDYMEEKVPYLDTEFSLSKLADYLNKPKYLVSQVLNVELGKSFYEFVNEYRFNEVKERLKDPANSNMTISAIAYDSGFHNKNTFNKVFKKQTGMTPSQFMEKYAGID